MAPVVSKLWCFVSAPFWLTRREFVQEIDPQSDSSCVVCVKRSVLEPGVLHAAFMFLFGCMYYFVLSVPVTYITAQKFTMVYWPSVLILAANSTFRFTLKYHERLAMILDWNEAVGRESYLRRAGIIFVGLAAGLSAGLSADWLISGSQFTPAGVGFACVLGVAEMIWNGKRIGGGAAYDHIELPQVHEVRTIVKNRF